MATRPTKPRAWPPHARAARDDVLTNLAHARELLSEARANIRDPRLLGELIADTQTLLADCEKWLELSKHGADT